MLQVPLWRASTGSEKCKAKQSMLILKNLHHSRAGQGKYVCSLRWVSVQGRVSDGAWSEYTLGSMGEVPMDAAKGAKGGLVWRGTLPRSHTSDVAVEGHRPRELGLSHLPIPTSCSYPWANHNNLCDLSLPL